MTAPINPVEAESFVDTVDDVARLVAGLAEGTITPDYVDRNHSDKLKGAGSSEEGEKPERSAAAGPSKVGGQPGPAAAAPKDADKDEEDEESRKAKLMEKAMALKTSYERKLKLRARFEEYVKSDQAHNFGTDYTKWDLWCPEDEEDDMISSITPNSAAFRAMEKDIDERHERMVEARQIAERMRVKGNAAFKDRQFSEALSCYQQGIASERTNMTLHANAAQAALKLSCYVQAVEHCDKALSIADFLHNNMRTPLCTKIYQRRATAYRAMQQHSSAVRDLEAAVDIEPDNKELGVQLATARREVEEQRKQKVVAKAMGSRDASDKADSRDTKATPASPAGLDMAKLRQVEQLSLQLVALAELKARAPHGPALPARPGSGNAQPAASSVQRATAASAALGTVLQDDDLACVYLRVSGGFQAAAQIVSGCGRAQSDSDERALVASCLALLNAACSNDGNLVMLPSTGVLPKVVAALGSRHAPEAAAAATLLCTACTNEDVRRAVSKELSSGNQLSGVLALLANGKPHVQESALSMLSNCMVDAPVKDAMRRVLAGSHGAAMPRDGGAGMRDAPASCDVDTGATLSALARSPRAAVQQRSLNLFGNMCGDAGLRAELLSAPGVLAAMVGALEGGSDGPGRGDGLAVQLAAANALYNLSIDPVAQARLLADGLAARMLPLIHSADAMLSARSVGVVARCCKQATWHAHLDSRTLLREVTGLLERSVGGSSVAPPADHAHRGDVDCACALGVDAGVRALALVSQDEAGHGAACALEMVSLGAPSVLLSIIQHLLPSPNGAPTAPTSMLPMTKSTRESILGNVALCAGHLARSPDALPLLHKLDAVQPLVRVAYEGKGSAASKNAAIALARMAKQPAMLERLRELHGVEIIYQYVRP